MINKEKNFVSVVFEIRNSEKYVDTFLKKIINTIDNYFTNYELVCVNNDSSDESVNIVKDNIKKYANENTVLNIINLSECVSFDQAITTGIEFAIGDFVFQFNTLSIDYSEDLILEAYKKILLDIDIVSVSPNNKSTFLQKGYYSLYNYGVDREKTIYPEKLKVISRRAINRVSEINNYTSLGTSVYKSCGLSTTTIFYNEGNDIITYDKQEYKKRFNNAIETIIVHTDAIPKILVRIFFILFIISICLLSVDFIYFLICFSLAVMTLLTTLILKYISILLNMTFMNKIQLVKSVEKVVK